MATLLSTSLSPSELNQLWDKSPHTNGKAPKVITYDQIIKAKSINKLFGKSNVLIVFYPNFRQDSVTSGHYITLIRDKKRKFIYFFDSYGGLPDIDQKKYAMNKNELYNEKHNSLINLLIKSNYNVDYNHVPIQSSDPNIATCGRHSLLRALWKHLTNDQYIQAVNYWSQRINKTPDEFVTMMFN